MSVLLVCPDKHFGRTELRRAGLYRLRKHEGGRRVGARVLRAHVPGLQRAGGVALAAVGGVLERGAGQPFARGCGEDDVDSLEPHVAEALFDAWVAEQRVPVFRNEWLDREKGVVKREGRIVSVTTLSGRTFRVKMFIDATYEGDLMAAAGVSYHVGREANSVYGETWNGVQLEAYKHHRHYFMTPTSPYRVPGDPASGVLPYVPTEPPGKDRRRGPARASLLFPHVPDPPRRTACCSPNRRATTRRTTSCCCATC